MDCYHTHLLKYIINTQCIPHHAIVIVTTLTFKLSSSRYSCDIFHDINLSNIHDVINFTLFTKILLRTTTYCSYG